MLASDFSEILDNLWSNNRLPYTSLIHMDICEAEIEIRSFFSRIMSPHTHVETDNNHDIIFLRISSNSQGQQQKNISIDNIREMQQEFANKPILSPYRFAVILGAEYLSVNSSNALLKILEDGPESTYFFIVTESPRNILPTIKSRSVEIFSSKMVLAHPKDLIDNLCKMLNPEVRFEDKEPIVTNYIAQIKNNHDHFIEVFIEALTNIILAKDLVGSQEYQDFQAYLEEKYTRESRLDFLEYATKTLSISKLHNLDIRQLWLTILSKFYHL